MAMVIDNTNITFEGVIYEDEVVSLREHLQTKAPDTLDFLFSECEDVHTAVVQQILAYKMLYSANFSFGDDKKTYQKLLEGFNSGEENCY